MFPAAPSSRVGFMTNSNTSSCPLSADPPPARDPGSHGESQVWPTAPPRRVTPVGITLARVLAVAQTVIGSLTTVTLLGLTWPTEGGPAPLAIAFTAIFAVSLGLTIAIACLTGALRPGSVQVRNALTVVESGTVVTTLALLTTADVDGSVSSLMVA